MAIFKFLVNDYLPPLDHLVDFALVSAVVVTMNLAVLCEDAFGDLLKR